MMPDQDQQQRKDPLAEEGSRETSQAEGDKPLGSRDRKVAHNPDTAEGDRERIEEDIQKQDK